jgi:hypothetical protein
MRSVVEKVRNGFRNLLKIRRKRRMSLVGARPMVNTYIYRGDIKMLVTHHLEDDAWQWLALQNWRKITFPNDRRRYRHLPKQALKILLRAPMDERERLHRRMLSVCSKRAA